MRNNVIRINGKKHKNSITRSDGGHIGIRRKKRIAFRTSIRYWKTRWRWTVLVSSGIGLKINETRGRLAVSIFRHSSSISETKVLFSCVHDRVYFSGPGRQPIRISGPRSSRRDVIRPCLFRRNFQFSTDSRAPRHELPNKNGRERTTETSTCQTCFRCWHTMIFRLQSQHKTASARCLVFVSDVRRIGLARGDDAWRTRPGQRQHELGVSEISEHCESTCYCL